MAVRRFTGSLGYNGDIARAVSLMARHGVDVRPLISTVMGLGDVPDWLAQPVRSSTGLKVLVDPGIRGEST